MGFIGDSKSTDVNVWGPWGATLIAAIDAAGLPLGNRCSENRSSLDLRDWAQGGRTAPQMAALIDDLILTHADNTWQDTYKFILNFGANDAGKNPPYTENEWKIGYRYIINAVLTKWPANSLIYIEKAWIRDRTTECNNFATWIDDLLAEFAISHPGQVLEGLDERVWFENGDDGATYSLYNDGTHYNWAGCLVKVGLLLTLLGY